jgi:hypothetical protein
MHTGAATTTLEDLDAVRFYAEAMQALREARVPFLVGGAFAFQRHADISRLTKDLDLFMCPRDVARALDVLASSGYRTEVAFPHWLAKAWSGPAFIDIIHNSGNGLVEVDDEWFARAPDVEVFGVVVPLTPVEEMIWSKSFVVERERCDAADVAHLIRYCSGHIDWGHLLARFGPHWRVLLAHLVLFGFVYPGERTRVPADVLATLTARLLAEGGDDAPERVCQGTLLSREQYLVDVERWGYEDGRLAPRGSMSPGDIAHWTAAIDRDVR